MLMLMEQKNLLRSSIESKKLNGFFLPPHPMFMDPAKVSYLKIVVLDHFQNMVTQNLLLKNF